MKAFPKTGSIEFCDPQTGMDLRDYFAAKAMQGFAADPDWQSGADKAAETAYRWADAMMKAREQ